MARELGMDPKKLGKMAAHHPGQWKLPLSQFIEHGYEKHFHQKQLQYIRSIEEKETVCADALSPCRVAAVIRPRHIA
jgi:hypothetical protein